MTNFIKELQANCTVSFTGKHGGIDVCLHYNKRLLQHKKSLREKACLYFIDKLSFNSTNTLRSCALRL